MKLAFRHRLINRSVVLYGNELLSTVFCSKFRHWEECFQFASEHLSYQAYWADDTETFDDFHVDPADACCSAYERDQGCPYELSQDTPAGEEGQDPSGEPPPPEEPEPEPEGGGEGGGGVGRRLARDSSRIASQPKATVQATPEASSKWWQSDDPWVRGAAKRGFGGVRKTTGKTVKLVEQPPSPSHREYSLLQRRNGMCTYDEKYGVWVKSSCHGTSTTLKPLQNAFFQRCTCCCTIVCLYFFSHSPAACLRNPSYLTHLNSCFVLPVCCTVRRPGEQDVLYGLHGRAVHTICEEV